MNEQNCKRKLASNDEIDDNKTSSFGFEAGEVPMVDTIGDGNSNINGELKLKMAALEVVLKNKFWYKCLIKLPIIFSQKMHRLKPTTNYWKANLRNRGQKICC
jgi:hypothetical protein